jgi:hypothetical protein
MIQRERLTRMYFLRLLVATALVLMLTQPALSQDAATEAAPAPDAAAEVGADVATEASPIETSTPEASASAVEASEAAVASEATPAAESELLPTDDANEPPVLSSSAIPKSACESPDQQAADRDWIKLSSGEWLSGSIDRIHDDTVYFDSEELDGVEIDLADVMALRSTQSHTFRFGRRDVQTGVARLDGDQISIETAAGPVVRDKKLLITMIPGKPVEKNYWDFNASVGLTLRQGNTNQFDVGSMAEIIRETAVTRFISRYTGSFNETDDDIQANSHRATAEFNIFVTRRLYIVLPVIEYYKDEIQNIEARIVPAAGLGYDLLDKKWIEWEFTLAAGYQYLVNGPPMPGAFNERSSDATVLIGTVINLDPTSDLEWDTTYKNTLVVTDLGQTSHHLQSVLSFDLWGPIDFDTTFVWDRVEDPALNVDGTQPESDDIRLTVGLGIDF